MIPKIIHYCWFGRGKKSKLMEKCIRSWKKYCPDYEIIEWNEDNFDINSVPWTSQAYKNKKWAFVADYVRLKALYEYGGIYLDTDQELLKPLDGFLVHPAFFGFISKTDIGMGLFGAEIGNSLIKEFFEHYEDKNFETDGKLDLTPNTDWVTKVFEGHGIRKNNTFQILDNSIYVYPRTYFCPVGMLSVEEDCISKDTYAIHHFASSWRSKQAVKAMKRTKRHTTKAYRIYEQIIAYPIAAYRKIFKKKG